MNRQSFGLWGIDLEPDDFACALAALGVWHVERNRYDRTNLGLPLDEAGPWFETLLREAVYRAVELARPYDYQANPVPAPVRWALPEPKVIRSIVRPGHARELAAAWQQLIVDPFVGNHLRIEIRLERFDRPTEPFDRPWEKPLDTSWERSDPPWLVEIDPIWILEQLSRAATGLASVYLAQEAHDSFVWNWPLQIGFLPDTESQQFTRALLQSRYVRHLFEIRELARLKLDAIKLSHHGGKKNTSADLLSQLQCPRYLFSSDGQRFGHPHPQTVARVIDSGAERPVLCFNYRSEQTRVWDVPLLKAKHRYTTRYPDNSTEGLVVSLDM